MGSSIWFGAAHTLLIFVLMEGTCLEGCWNKERDRLLDFKTRCSDPSVPDSDPADLPFQTPFINWVDGTDCCQWDGVMCDSTTRRVVNLTLDCTWVSYGSSRHLNFSDLLVFGDLKALEVIGIDGCLEDGGLERRRFSNLQVLKVLRHYDYSDFVSFNIEPCVSAFSSLKSLQLRNAGLTTQSFQSLEKLHSIWRNLEVLDLSGNYHLTNNMLQFLWKVTSLKTLFLVGTGLDSGLNFPGLASRLINLEVLDMSNNDFSGAEDIFPSLSGFSSLKSLILRNCHLTSTSISSLSKLHSLEVLDLSENDLDTSFRTLSAQDNGSLPWPTSLEVLALRANRFGQDIVSSFKGLHRLKSLDLSNNNLGKSLNITDNGRLPKPWPTSLEVLALGANRLGNDIFSSLSGLQHLKSLDLSNNNLEKSLNITGLSTLSNLEMLDLGCNSIDNFFVRQGTKFSSSLKVLILDEMDMGASLLRNSLKAFSSITTLNLNFSYFKGTAAAGDLGELSNLENLVLNSCKMPNEFLKSIGALTSLKVLSLSNCRINGTLPAADWSNLKKLEELDISYNEFEGPLPWSFGNMTSLRRLDMSHNRFTGNLAPNLAGLTSLEYLDITENQFQVPASFSFFVNHSYLKFIYGGGNNVILDHDPASRTWAPKFQLHELILASATTQTSSIPFPNFLLYQNKLTLVDFSGCKFGGEFPNWLLENNTKMIILNLRNNSFTGHVRFPSHPTPKIRIIDVSDNAITGQILVGNNISSVFPTLHFLNMSSNLISGTLPHELGLMTSLISLYFSDNSLSGEIPANISAGRSWIGTLILSNNQFSGPVSPLLALHHLWYLRLDGNFFSGMIPSSFFNASGGLSYVDLSNNHFVGKLPRLVTNSSSLQEFAVSNNHLEGSIPEEYFGTFSSLDLSGNSFSGSVPSLVNSSLSTLLLSGNRLSSLTTGVLGGHGYKENPRIRLLDLSNNEISGTIQNIIDIVDPDELNILGLKGNQFRGHIPKNLCNLSFATILDFSHNSLSGPIPNCLGEIRFTPDPDAYELLHFTYYPPSIVHYEANFTTKSIGYRYDGNILRFMTGMDFSHNRLEGKIPAELGNMTGIRAMNLSHNDLTGHIPSSLANLETVESLDLSYNKLSGRIPPQLTRLSSIEVFSVAHNNLSGETPDRKGQFITFDERSYEGNPFLCGPPLPTSCGDHIGQLSPSAEEEDADSGFMDMDVFYISMAVSWTMVLLVLAVVLYINPYWRRAWFYFIEFVIDTCYFFLVDHFPNLY